jgi:uncharacterized membrane protein (UPF0127 family)
MVFAALLALPGAAAAEEVRSATVAIQTASGLHTFTVEWAVTPEERAKGLMFRESMAEDHGMVFDFGTELPVTFWMKNTPLSLDMIFIRADGSVDSIARNTTPFSEATVPSSGRVQYVLEVLAGTADRIGLEPGDTVTLR